MRDRYDLAGSTVLIAEDEVIVALELEATLRDCGCAVLGPAMTSDEALELLRRQRPDAALLDATLTDGSARPLAEALLRAGVPVGLATGYSAAELAPPLRGLPVLDKPYQSSDVIEFVRRLIGTGGHLPPDTSL